MVATKKGVSANVEKEICRKHKLFVVYIKHFVYVCSLLQTQLFSQINSFMEAVKNAVNWFEIPVTDFARAKRFYEAIFDFEMPEMEMEGVKMGILLYDQPGNGVGGAICQGEWYTPAGNNGTKVYLNGGDDLHTVLNRVERAGGQVIMPKTPIGQDMGYMAFFHDTEGNMVGLHSMN